MNNDISIAVTAPGIQYTLNRDNHPKLAALIDAMIGAGRSIGEVASNVRQAADDAMVALHEKVGATVAAAAAAAGPTVAASVTLPDGTVRELLSKGTTRDSAPAQAT